MTNSKCIPMYILVHNLSHVLFNTNVHTYTASPVLYYYPSTNQEPIKWGSSDLWIPDKERTSSIIFQNSAPSKLQPRPIATPAPIFGVVLSNPVWVGVGVGALHTSAQK